MHAGMGDVVFAPLYEVLKRRGVRFEFFHRLDNVRLAPERGDGRAHVEALEFDVQARVVGGRRVPSRWSTSAACPAGLRSPDYSQLVDGARLQQEGWDFESALGRPGRLASASCERGQDFDMVVLARRASAPCRHVCGEILARDERWRAMVEHVKSVPTQASRSG